MKLLLVLLGSIAATAALPSDAADPVIKKMGGERYQPMIGGDGVVHMVDTWLKVSDLELAARFQPDTSNVYHLFTRSNTNVSQPLVLNNADLLASSNYDPDRRTVFLIHGWNDNVTGTFNSVLIPAFLNSTDANVISVDWSAGADTSINYLSAVVNTVTSGESVARFIDWLMNNTGTTPEQIHIVGHSLGGQQSGIVGRNVNGTIDYITALDPAGPGWILNSDKFRSDDGAYTEVIHTNAGLAGYLTSLGQVDFYPNGGVGMPGCGGISCEHNRSFYYFGESLTSGGFTAEKKCATFVGGLTGACLLSGSLQMGGLTPKTGSEGIYHLDTNAAPPFSMD